MTDFFQDQIKSSLAHLSLQGELLANASLAKYTTWRVGGPADYLYRTDDIDELANLLLALPLEIPITLLGAGSNVLIRSGGVPGLVILTSDLNQIQKQGKKIAVESGVLLRDLARYSVRYSLTGLEFLVGIPGTVGGALAMNAGCLGSNIWDFVDYVYVINRRGEVIQRYPSDYEIGYRSLAGPQHEWFISAKFILKSGDKDTSLDKIRDILQQRNSSQPVTLPNCGSVFRNPDGDYAARLIEATGLKGLAIGGARVSEQHANFIVNDKNASADDIY